MVVNLWITVRNQTIPSRIIPPALPDDIEKIDPHATAKREVGTASIRDRPVYCSCNNPLKGDAIYLWWDPWSYAAWHRTILSLQRIKRGRPHQSSKMLAIK